MRDRLRKVYRDERGMSFVLLGLGFMAFLVASTLAIDVGLLATARTEAQRSADAGALAGAVALVFDDYSDRSGGGPAVQSAVSAASANDVGGSAVSVTPGDVTFMNDAQGLPNRVRVEVFRSAGRANPLSMLVAAFFGVASADVTAVATAEASPANAATCVKPWAVPDKWDERQTPPFDPVNDSYDLYRPNGTPLPNPDRYVPVGSAGYSGYQPDPAGPDYGLRVTLKAGNPHQAISSSHFYPIALPPGTGGSWYEQNISGCWPDVMEIGAVIPVEPGNMTGPTIQGAQALIAQDPGAYWDTGTGRIVSAQHPSPRLIVMPVFDPDVYEHSRQHGRQDIQVANLVGFFVERLAGNDVVGRLVPATGLVRGNGAVPLGAYLRQIRLVQ